MNIGKTLFPGGVALLTLALALCCAQPASAGGEPLLLAQQGPGMMQPGQQGGMRQPQGQQPAPAQPAAPQQPGQPAGGNANACMQSYQRCVMVCAGVANCINNCNVGYAVCTQPQGGRPGGS
ncbi:hypothetical protein [Solidesulfovibrio sp.]|uniref:hypothetical protein n=1 Tax=Solidesulfovibrio sp. TaxID=2910990 RepID=UPI0026278B00|nr:hypothetical protein [Solidesulfovibrio sp.]